MKSESFIYSNEEIKSRVKNSGFQDDNTGMWYPGVSKVKALHDRINYRGEVFRGEFFGYQWARIHLPLSKKFFNISALSGKKSPAEQAKVKEFTYYIFAYQVSYHTESFVEFCEKLSAIVSEGKIFTSGRYVN